MENQNIPEEKLRRQIEQIRFKPIDTDPDMAYGKLWYRIKYQKLHIQGVSRIWKYSAIVASIALLVISSLFLLKPGDAIDYINIIATPGSRTHIVLPDSSSVWLNSNAKIRYPQKFSGENREIDFEGEGFFEITNDKKNPFIVKIAGMQVQVLGTSFNIHAIPESDVIEVTVTEGSVALFTETNEGLVADQILHPDQQALYNKTDNTFEMRNIRPELYAAWVTGQFFFKNNSLQEIVTVLERTFDTNIYIEDEELKDIYLTARFTHQETLDEILSILQTPAKYKYRKVKGRIYIHSK